MNGNPEWYKDGYNNDERYVGEIENEKPNGQGVPLHCLMEGS